MQSWRLVRSTDSTGPILIGSDADVEGKTEVDLPGSWKQLPPHRDEEQVQLDVNRAFVYYPHGTSV
jgi:TBC1 domain family member 20